MTILALLVLAVLAGWLAWQVRALIGWCLFIWREPYEDEQDEGWG